LYLVAGATGIQGNRWVYFDGAALAAYIIGLSYLARRERLTTRIRVWPMFFLAVPILLAGFRETNRHTESALLISLALGLWVLRCLRSTLWSPELNIGRTVSGLLAGIVLVDWAAAANCSREMGFVFIVLFLAALLFQRFVPAT